MNNLEHPSTPRSISTNITDWGWNFFISNWNIGLLFGNSRLVDITQWENYIVGQQSHQPLSRPLKFFSLKQIHSDLAVEQAYGNTEGKATTHQPQEADAHWTNDTHCILSVRTADCIPVLIATPGCIAAVHAGWRGIESMIIPKTLDQVRSSTNTNRTDPYLRGNDCLVMIGPHIQTESFEVSIDVAERLGGSKYKNTSVYPHPTDAAKRLVDLSAIAHDQIISSGVSSQNILQIKENTYTNDKLHSFRRDGKNAGRQISFIYRLPAKLN